LTNSLEYSGCCYLFSFLAQAWSVRLLASSLSSAEESVFASPRVRPNPSLNHRTRYGGLSWPGLRYTVHFRSPGQAIPPQRSG
jgi:hypothetical protein